MATAAQIAANRANALKSTGPRTQEGKDASRFNALRHGADAESIVIPGEDPAEYERVAAGYYEEFQPQSSVEEFHVQTLIRSDWQKRRLQRVEAKLYRKLQAEGSTLEDLDVALLLESPTSKLLHKVFAQISSLDRAFYRALTDLRRTRRERERYAIGLAFAHARSERERRSASADTPKLASFPEAALPASEIRRDLNPTLRL